MKQNMMVAIGACLAVFLAAPYIPAPLLNLVVGNYVGVFVLLAANLYLLQINLTVALAFFFACGGLFLQSRKQTLAKVESALQKQESIDGTSMAPVSNLSVKAEDLIEGEVHPEHDEPAGERHGYEQAENSQSNRFERVGESVNQKNVLDTEESTSGVFR